MYSFDWGFIWVLIVQLVLAIGIAWIIVQWVKLFSKKKETRPPLDIAKERYARGEITKDELEEIKSNLEEL
jgi:putative membrane protein